MKAALLFVSTKICLAFADKALIPEAISTQHPLIDG